MVRVDIFTKNNKYYAVPIYVADTVKKVLPNKAITAHKEKKNWVEMTEEFQFCFSLYSHDLIRIKKGDEILVAYYKSIHSSTGSITLGLHDRSEKKEITTGIQNLKIFEKLCVDPLGEIVQVKSEKRHGF